MSEKLTVEEKRKDPEYLLDLLKRIDECVSSCCQCINHNLDGLPEEVDAVLEKKS